MQGKEHLDSTGFQEKDMLNFWKAECDKSVNKKLQLKFQENRQVILLFWVGLLLVEWLRKSSGSLSILDIVRHSEA